VKKTLLGSTLPVISNIEDAKPGVVTHAVVFRTYEKHIMVEFYNNMKATIPLRETG
jgi:rRNA biogenesis protein RRP5